MGQAQCHLNSSLHFPACLCFSSNCPRHRLRPSPSHYRRGLGPPHTAIPALVTASELCTGVCVTHSPCIFKEPESGHAGVIVLTALWMAEFGGLDTPGPNMSPRMAGRGYWMSPDKPKVLLFLNGYHKNIFHIFTWKLLLISHLKQRVNLCVCVSSYWYPI